MKRLIDLPLDGGLYQPACFFGHENVTGPEQETHPSLAGRGEREDV